MSGKLYQVQNGQKVDVTPTIAALTDVSTKADVTLGNLTPAGKVAMTHAAMPSGYSIDLMLPANGGTVTVPADGYLTLYLWKSLGAGGWNGNLIMNMNKYGVTSNGTGGGGAYITLSVSKGDVVTISWGIEGAGTITPSLYFTYANGSAPQP